MDELANHHADQREAQFLAKAYRWQNASPQYEVGHAARVSEIEKLAGLHRGLHLAGAAYHGAGLPDCIQSGIDAAEKTLLELTAEDEQALSLRRQNGRPMIVERSAEISMPITGAVRPHHHGAGDYAKNPLIVYWEMTQACGLACRHCRAEAMPQCHPEELTHEQGKQLLQQIADFGEPLPHLILTGGDPLRRPDLYELIDEAVRLSLHLSITPSATPDLTNETLVKLKAHGVESLGLSLDGSTPARHEAVRGVAGCFELTVEAARNAAALGMPIQVNTLVSQETVDDLPAIYELLSGLNINRWSLFFLIAIGRGKTIATDLARTWRAIDELDLRSGRGLRRLLLRPRKRPPIAALP